MYKFNSQGIEYTSVGRSSERRQSKSNLTIYKGRGITDSKIVKDRIKMDLRKYYMQFRNMRKRENIYMHRTDADN